MDIHIIEYFLVATYYKGKSQINGSNPFGAFAKAKLAKFYGLTDDNFILHLKECEFSFNSRQTNIYLLLLKLLTQFLSLNLPIPIFHMWNCISIAKK